ncbi:tetratricopeptide repeat protein [Fulvivirga maritima]|uniref:tetratricopeptide repeat protein n=1 Tax=Fulvivirga maritima TaxID=2904247 RepID=UPI001F3B1668|nr:tetratricopeptide repeat protein [Fulvivirga maritima]UII27664.1 tetratricopeptide repeat protein [Fulvivirga maritima]
MKLLRFKLFNYCIALAVAIISCTEPEEMYKRELPEDTKGLEQLLSGNGLDDKARMSIHFELYKDYKSTDLSLAEEHVDQLLSISQKHGNIYYQARGEYSKAFIANLNSDYKLAIDHYLTASELFASIDDHLRNADAIHNIGDIFFRIKAYDSALPYFQKAASLYEKVGDWYYLAHAQKNIATSKYKLEEWNEATAYYNESINSLSKSGKEYGEELSNLCNKLGNVAYNKQDYDKAVEYSEKALAMSNVSDRQKHLIYLNIANIYNAKGEFNQTRKWLDKAHELASQISLDEANSILSLNIEGELYQLQGEHAEAIRTFNRAIAQADKEVINESLIQSLNLISKSQRALVSKGGRVNINEIFKVEDLRKKQDDLRVKLVDQLDYKRLQVLLDKEIEIHYRDIKQAEIDRERATIINWASALILLFILLLIGTAIYLKVEKVNYETKVKKVRDLLNEG